MLHPSQISRASSSSRKRTEMLTSWQVEIWTQVTVTTQMEIWLSGQMVILSRLNKTCTGSPVAPLHLFTAMITIHTFCLQMLCPLAPQQSPTLVGDTLLELHPSLWMVIISLTMATWYIIAARTGSLIPEAPRLIRVNELNTCSCSTDGYTGDSDMAEDFLGDLYLFQNWAHVLRWRHSFGREGTSLFHLTLRCNNTVLLTKSWRFHVVNYKARNVKYLLVDYFSTTCWKSKARLAFDVQTQISYFEISSQTQRNT